MWVTFWLVVMLLAAIGEVFTYDLFLGSVAVAALFAAGLALFVPVALQSVAFAGLSLTGIVLVRPALKRVLGIGGLAQEQNSLPQTHIQGRHGLVTRAIDMGAGQVRLGKGEFWTARPFDATETFKVGDHVEVLYVDGLTALVARAQTIPFNLTSGAENSDRPRERGIS